METILREVTTDQDLLAAWQAAPVAGPSE